MKKLKFLLCLSALQDEYQAEQARAAREMAQELDVELDIVNAGNDPIRQTEQLLRIIQAPPIDHPHALIVEPVGRSGMPQVARAAAAAGIGWIIVNRDVEYISELRKTFQIPTFTVSGDDVDLGRIQAKQIAALMPEGGSIMYIQGPMTSLSVQLRTVGLCESKLAGIDITTLRALRTRESANRSVDCWLRLPRFCSKDLCLVAAHNDVMAQGAREAFQESYHSHRWSHLLFTGCDGTTQCGQALVRSGVLAATVVRPPAAEIAIDLLARSIRTHAGVAERILLAPISYPSIEKLAQFRAPSRSRFARLAGSLASSIGAD
jgi:ABC-type sugar transport system substrate-binding protein